MPDDNTDLYGPIGELGGEAIGDLIAQGKYDQVQSLLNELKGQYANLPGATPVSATGVGSSNVSGVTEDPRYSSAENEALRQMMGVANSGGMSAADKAKLENAKLAGLSVSRGMRGATEDSLRRRGLYSSGAELSADLAGQQGGINTAYQGDVSTAAAASDRALAALQAGGQYASQLGSRDLTQKDLAAQSNDRISQFNATRADAAKYYNSPLAQANALARLKGMGATDDQIASLLTMMGKGSAAKGGGYGRQLGDLLGALSGNKKGGGSNPSDAWTTQDAPGQQGSLDFNANLQPDLADYASAGGSGSDFGDYFNADGFSEYA